MDLWLNVPIFCLLLICSGHSYADSSSSLVDTSSGEKTVDLPTSRNLDFKDPTVNRAPDQQDLLRLLFLAAQNNQRHNSQFRGKTWNIPFRPVRRIGSEFLGKRSDVPPLYDYDGIEKRTRMGSEFLGKRAMGSEFLGKRGMGSEFLGKRGMGSEFLGKRKMGSEFLGKRGMGSEFLGKRGMGSEFLGKRGMGSEFLGKRDYDGYPEPLYIERSLPSSSYLFHNYDSVHPTTETDEDDFPSHSDPMYNFLIQKRGMGSEFLGKRKQSNDYSFKRTRLGSEFLGKRSATPEQPYPYLQTDTTFDSTLPAGKFTVGNGQDKPYDSLKNTK